jgi:1-acyl-sn-glycerol-3-phosphate acyltransferase
MIYDNIINTINNDLDFVNKTNIIFLLILLILFYYLKKDNYFILTIINIIKKIRNPLKINVVKKDDEDNEIIQIFDKMNISNQIFNPKILINKLPFIELIKMCLINIKIKSKKTFEIFMRTLLYDNSFSIIKYSKKIKNIPDKFIILLNHTHIDYNDLSHVYLLLSLFPEHNHCVITNDKYKVIKKYASAFFNQYVINKETIYQDISKIINDNKKIIIIIFPEGNIKRICNTNFDINKPNIDNFEIIEERCFNYKKGAFIMSMMNNVPILQTIFYSPIPNYNYNYFGKTYEIKHINHIGINVYNFQKFKKGITVENYRKTMEDLFKKRYINTLINAHKFNIVLDKKIN